MRPLCLALLSLFLASAAFAADGDLCTPSTTPACVAKPGWRTQFLCQDEKETSGDTSCNIEVEIAEKADFCAVEIVQQQAACTIPTITVEESSRNSGVEQGWTTLGTLTGIVSPLVSQVDVGRAVGPALRATFADFTDADCTSVSLVLKCHY